MGIGATLEHFPQPALAVALEALGRERAHFDRRIVQPEHQLAGPWDEQPAEFLAAPLIGERGVVARQESLLPSSRASAAGRPQSAQEQAWQIRQSVLYSLTGKGPYDPQLMAALKRWQETH